MDQNQEKNQLTEAELKVKKIMANKDIKKKM